jgi:hypothetical protein
MPARLYTLATPGYGGPVPERSESTMYSIPVGAILDTWSNDPGTNGLQSVPVKIVLDWGEIEDQLLRVSMPVGPKMWMR